MTTIIAWCYELVTAEAVAKRLALFNKPDLGPDFLTLAVAVKQMASDDLS
jgi:hypothetical protein